MIAQDLLTALQGVSSDVSERGSADCPAFNCPIESLFEVLKTLRDNHGYDMLVDATGIDNGVEEHPRFTVVYHLLSTSAHRYVRVAADCADSEKPVAPSVVSLWEAANWHERECFDLLGISYSDHPDLRRILMWDDYPYHPLRKDFPLAGHEEDLWDEEISERTGTKVISAPMAGGPFVAKSSSFEAEREPRAKDESWNEKKEKPGE
ncbi:NADH-quinone oxidoreductase subunit C [Pelagicoccus sp. SDUM812003]|uniref:NADH-quinone oxidoreductase subunit C n=1 Tax=Pelagicoccus sp. SDUM812003 TaxID=3041267 RepID=UPI00280CB1A6|nr:NADH-quinone oxidoreductase subunit C [Pelagicoccus sp. SDUM812003]MDQ8202644.1 NADH-quinone oxidoreductase subunit C [Pelagicoccus sp. SDUM812003]